MLSDKGYSREQIRDLDMEWANEIIFPPRDEKGIPTFVGKLAERVPKKLGKSSDPIDMYRHFLWLQGWPAHKINEKMEQLKAERDEMLKAAGLRG